MDWAISQSGFNFQKFRLILGTGFRRNFINFETCELFVETCNLTNRSENTTKID